MQFEQPSTLRYAVPGKKTKVTKVDSSAFSAGSAEKPKNQPLCFVNFVTFCSKIFTAKRTELTVSESNPAPGLRFLILEKLPLLGLVLTSCLVTMHVQQAAAAALERIPWIWRLLNAPVATVAYLVKTAWPTKLAFLYPHPADVPGERLGDWALLAGGATLLLVLTSLVLLRARRRPYCAVGWLWFLGMLVPVIGLLQVGNQAWADRYAYLPLVGVYMIISWSLARFVQTRPDLRPAVIAVVAAVLLAILPLTRKQVAVWRDTRSLYEHALAVTRNNFQVHNNWGAVLQEMGRFDEALAQHQRALQIRPEFAKAHNNWGLALIALGDREGGMAQYGEALRIKPNYAEAHNNWGNALQTLGRLDEAVVHYREALRIRPDYAKVYNNLGVVEAGRGRLADAVESFEKAIRAEPNYPDAKDNLRKVRAMMEE